MTGGCSGNVLFGPFTHHLTFGHLYSPVDDDVVVHTKLDVSVYSLTITETIAAHITPTNIVLACFLVVLVRDEPVTCTKDGLVLQNTTHGLCVVSSYFVH